MDIRPVLDLDRFRGILRQAPELALHIVLRYSRSAELPASAARLAVHGVFAEPMLREGGISSLKRGDGVVFAFVKPISISLSEEAGTAVPFFVCRHKRERGVQAVNVEA